MKKILSLLAAVLFAGSMMADQVTVTASNFTATTESAFSKVIEGVKFSCSTGTVGNEIRIFADNTFTISVGEGGSISKIDFTSTANGSSKFGLGKFAALDGFTYDASATTGSWTGNATEVTFNASAQVRLTQIVVTYVRGTVDPEEGTEGGGGDHDYTYDENSNYVVEFASYTVDASDFDTYGDLYIEAQDADMHYVAIDLYPETAELTPGTYQIRLDDGTYPVGSVTAGEFWNDDIYASYAAIVDANDYLTNVWYMVSGTVVVAEDGTITVNALNSKGNTISVIMHNGGQAGIENVVLEDSARKVMVDGAMYIIRDKKMYNAQGAVVR